MTTFSCDRDRELAAQQKDLAKRDKAVKVGEKALAAKEGRARTAAERLKEREAAAKEQEVGHTFQKCFLRFSAYLRAEPCIVGLTR